MTAQKALVLDFGGVISKTLYETHDLSEAALGLPKGTLTWRGPFDPARDEPFQAMQTRRDDRARLLGLAPARNRRFCGRDLD